MDFYFMHCVNSSIFFPTFLDASSPLPVDAKVRLLEWKMRLDLAMYASRRAPPLLTREITDYRPKRESGWAGLFARINGLGEDDGHAAKLLRTVGAVQKVSEKYGEGMDLRIEGDMWLKIGHMVVDSVEGYGGKDEPKWGRSVGFDEAWVNIPGRPVSTL
jgi:hypothetical protein